MGYDTATSPIVRYGYGVIGIPGVVAGLTKLHLEHGTLPLETVMKPAIKYVKKGFPILKGEAMRHASALELMKQFEGHISPMLVSKDGEPFMTLGAVGGSRIPTAIVSVLSRVIDQDMSLGNALKAARVYHDGEQLLIEAYEGSGWKSTYTTTIEKAGFPIKVLDTKARFGRVHAYALR